MQTSSIDFGRAVRLSGRDIVASLALATIALALTPVIGLVVLLFG
jgi:hypothetical protein